MGTRRPSREQETFHKTFEHAALTATTTIKKWKNKTGRQVKITGAQYLNVTGLAQDASNSFKIGLNQGAVEVAKWNTATGTDGTVVADTHMTMVLSATPADLIIEPDELLSLVLTETGTANLPAGQVEVTGIIL